VDGKSSLACYLMTLDRCYARLCAKYAQRAAAASAGPDAGAAPGASAADAAAAARASARLASANRGAPARPPAEAPAEGGRDARRSPGPPPAPPAGRPGFSLAEVDYCVFHSPFNKLVRKAFARLWYADHLRARRAGAPAAAAAAPDPGGVSLAAAFAAAAATAPARLGSEGATAAAELAGEEPAGSAVGCGVGPAGAPSGARGPSGADACCAAGPTPGARCTARPAVHAVAGGATVAAPGAAPGQRDAGQGCGGAAAPAAACAAAGQPCPQQRGARTGSANCREGAAGVEPGAASRPPDAPPGASCGAAGPEPGRPPHPLDAFPADPDALPAGSYGDRALEAAALAASAAGYDALVAPGTGLALDVGNMYTGARMGGIPHSSTLFPQCLTYELQPLPMVLCPSLFDPFFYCEKREKFAWTPAEERSCGAQPGRGGGALPGLLPLRRRGGLLPGCAAALLARSARAVHAAGSPLSLPAVGYPRVCLIAGCSPWGRACLA